MTIRTTDESALLTILEANELLFYGALREVIDADFIRRLDERTNSMQWIAGHLAHTRAQMARLVDAHVDVRMHAFAEPIDPQRTYADRPAIVSAWETATHALYDRLANVTASELARPAPIHFPVRDRSVAGGLAFFSQHEAYHLGQLGFLRKAMGYPAVRYS